MNPTPKFDFAVIDLETTGIHPNHHERVVEIAVVHVNGAGQVLNEWASLINPKRHVGATEIHGITAADLLDAPTFDDIAGDLVELLRGKVLVAHNLQFDISFLRSEFERTGAHVPITPACGLCTMQLALEYLNTKRRTLEACCDAIGYQFCNAHSALADARGAAHLLSHYLCETPAFVQDCAGTLPRLAAIEWPNIEARRVAPVARHGGAKQPRDHFLAKFPSRVVGVTDGTNERSYFALLDRILLDREVCLHEERELVSAATAMGISREDGIRLNHQYLEALVVLAREDGVVTIDERDDLHQVSRLLGIETSVVDHLLDSSHTCTELSRAAEIVASFSLQVGDAIVFTGDAPQVTRDELRAEAEKLGLIVKGSVTKKTRLVVAADPDSLSGKAERARMLGVPIVGYPTYFRLIDGIDQ